VKKYFSKEFIRENALFLFLALISCIFIIIFAKITEDVWTKEAGILNWDKSILISLVKYRTSFLNAFFINFTRLGEASTVIGVSAIVCALLLYKRELNYLVFFAASILGDIILVFSIKELVHRARPDVVTPLVHETGFSFISGHTFASVCFFGVLCFLFMKNIKNRLLRQIGTVLALLFIVLMGFSRLYLGVHWPSDVIASYILAIAFVFSLYVMAKNRKRILAKLR